jgi:hypothetical protein
MGSPVFLIVVLLMCIPILFQLLPDIDDKQKAGENGGIPEKKEEAVTVRLSKDEYEALLKVGDLVKRQKLAEESKEPINPFDPSSYIK